MRTIYPLLLALVGAALSGCGGPANDVIDCPGGEQRVRIDCSNEVAYQGAKGEGSISVMDIAGASGSFEDKAIRRVSEHIQQFASMHTRLCREYNSCVVDQTEYRAKADDIQKRLMLVPALSEAVKSSKTEAERTKALDQLYQALVPDEDRVEEVTFRFGFAARFPESLGGGDFVLAPGGTVTTDTKVWITVEVSKDAYLYMFQTTPEGEVSVLFPHPGIQTLANPLRGRMPVRIPPNAKQYFRVNEKDVGTEKVYFVVSKEPVDDLAASLSKVQTGDVTSVSQDSLLQSVAAVPVGDGPSRCKTRSLELVTEEGCVRSRGLELAGDPSPAGAGSAPPPSMELRTAPGDSRIVKVFHFEHLTQEQFQARGGTGSNKVRSRGIIIED
ncbi:MAG: DUF4384 domain-containing protein [Deltaproteobacteria bacterium]|jgi:hypothetical protein|nr:DUF4384 domain-containing protein [Deltaproteobacteria bacterium]MBW2535157.1 DUF4384 domain-containing protein [Deltaproteobacteria bacterium]